MMISGIATKIKIYSSKNQSSVTSVLLITSVTNVLRLSNVLRFSHVYDLSIGNIPIFIWFIRIRTTLNIGKTKYKLL